MTKSNPRGSDLTALEILEAPAKAAGGAVWSGRHDRAMASPNGIERGIVNLVKGWARYADEHYEAYGSSIGEDAVLGAEWEEIGRSLLGLLNGDLGRLDGGTLDGRIREIFENEDVELEE